MNPGKRANQSEVCLPSPLERDRFNLLRDGISDDPGLSVFINAARDFAYLTPPPVVDYAHYQPRWQKLGLPAQSRKDEVLRRRAAKIAPHLVGASNLLEIGAGDASFLDPLRQHHPGLRLSSCEPDQNTRPQRDEKAWLDQYDGWNEVSDCGIAFDVVALFHVFEHFADPAAFLRNCRGWLNVGGRVIVEVPSLTDPLLSLYAVPAYEAFYFQKQHPFVYSGASVGRVLENAGWRVIATVPFQRYGLSNHLNWLQVGEPGGDERFAAIFAGAEDAYREQLEQTGYSDTVIVVGTPA